MDHSLLRKLEVNKTWLHFKPGEPHTAKWPETLMGKASRRKQLDEQRKKCFATQGDGRSAQDRAKRSAHARRPAK
ncbi:hypothetical protein GQ600_18952 [Phytophthora cactorum]|nr:hypothetical protein GQ600_18952 [Phytophthora cactorum]